MMNIKNYKINLFGCKNGHNINNILFEDFQKTQEKNIKLYVMNVIKILKLKHIKIPFINAVIFKKYYAHYVKIKNIKILS